MKEYIEREAALKEFEKVCNVCMALVNKPMCGDCSVADTVRKVKSIPAADVRPVVRGHWISEEEAEEKGDYSLRDACSVCGHCDWDCTESAGFNYCPNCGADMRNAND